VSDLNAGRSIYPPPTPYITPTILAGVDIQQDLTRKTVMPYAMAVINIGDHPIKKAIGIPK